MAYGTWYYDAVEYAVANGLMNGFNDGTFKPMGTLTRGQMVTVLYRMAGSPDVPVTQIYSDVPTSKWYAQAVAWGSQSGVVTGYPDGTFKPEKDVTREQIAAMLYRNEGSPAVDASILNSFPDQASVQSYARNAMAWAVSKGLITGVRANDGLSYLQPGKYATRAQFATIMMRYIENG